MINNHVVSLDLAKQLYEAGIKIESEFLWARYEKQWIVESRPFVKRSKCDEVIPAPLASELGEILPKTIVQDYGNPWLSIHGDKYPICWYCSYVDLKGPRMHQCAATIPDAMAKMAIYLKEKGLL